MPDASIIAPHQDLSVAPTVNMDLNAIFLAAQDFSSSRPQ